MANIVFDDILQLLPVSVLINFWGSGKTTVLKTFDATSFYEPDARVDQ